MHEVPFVGWKALAAHLQVCLCLWDNWHKNLKKKKQNKQNKNSNYDDIKENPDIFIHSSLLFPAPPISVLLSINIIASLETEEKYYKYWAEWKGILTSLPFRTDADDSAISKSEDFFFASCAMNWSVDIRGGNRLLDHQFTFLSKQQLNLFSFSQLTSCSKKKRAFQLPLMESETKQRSLVSEHVQWLRGGGRKEAEERSGNHS